MTNQELLAELITRFPGIDEEDTALNGADTVDYLCQWFSELGGKIIPCTCDEDYGEECHEPKCELAGRPR